MFGERLRKLRVRRGLSVRELGRRAGVPHETVSRLENDHQRYPSLPVAMRIAKVLGVTLDYLAGMYDEEEDEEATASILAGCAPHPSW